MTINTKIQESIKALDQAFADAFEKDTPLYKPSELAVLLGVDVRTIYRDIDKLGLITIKLGPKSTRVPKSQADRLAAYRGTTLPQKFKF